MESMDAILGRFLSAVPTEWCNEVRREFGYSGGGGLFSYPLICWLMILQRWKGLSVESAWLSVSPELALRFSPTSKRAISGVLSAFAGGYDHARRAMPIAMAEAVFDRLFTDLSVKLSNGEPSAYVLDGTTLSPDGSAKLREAYPPHSNQHGDSHFPHLRLLFAHELGTAMALRPLWGPVRGKDRVSEQSLALEMITRLPAGAMVVADRGFGVYSITYSVTSSGRPCLIRMTAQRFLSLVGKDADLSFDQEREFVWKPSAHDRRKHPEIPKDAKVSGRLIVRHVIPSNSQRVVRLLLFVSGSNMTGDELAAIYAKRWSIETDIRTLKGKLGLDRPSARLPDVLAKELILGVAAYNLVRAMGALAAEHVGIKPRQVSFTRMVACMDAYEQRLLNAKNQEEIESLLFEMYTRVTARTLKPRVRPNPPRETWERPKSGKRRSTKEPKKT
jgi:Transposase DDE domain